MRKRLIKFLGGYVSVDDAFGSKTLEERLQILNRRVKFLFNTISPDDLLKENEYGQWIIDGKPLREDQSKLLVSEVVNFNQSLLWKVLQKDIEYQIRKMFIQATGKVDIISPKIWLLTLDCIKTRLKSISKGSGTFNRRAVRQGHTTNS